jgi:hypothetical protein
MFKVFCFVSAVTALCFSETQFKLIPEGTFKGSYHRTTSASFSGFEIYQNDAVYARVDTSSFHGGYTYSIDGKYAGSQYPAYFSLGFFSDSLREFTVYDESNNILGLAKGIRDTDAAAEFHFTNQEGQFFAKAILNREYSCFRIVDNNDQELFVCTKVFRDSFSTVTYYWNIRSMDDEHRLDERFLWPLLSFICEYWWM